MSCVLGSSEASPELILSRSMCNECEFFGLDSDEDVCLSLLWFLAWTWLLVILLGVCGTVLCAHKEKSDSHFIGSQLVIIQRQLMERRCVEQKVGHNGWRKLGPICQERERSEGVIDVELNGRVNPVFQEKSITGLMCSLGGTHHRVLTGKSIADTDSQYARKSSARRWYVEGRQCVHRYSKFLKTTKNGCILWIDFSKIAETVESVEDGQFRNQKGSLNPRTQSWLEIGARVKD